MTGGHPVVMRVSSLLLRPGQYLDKTIVEKDDMEDRFFPQYTFTNMQGLGWDPLVLATASVWTARKTCQHLLLQVSLRCHWNSQDCFVKCKINKAKRVATHFLRKAARRICAATANSGISRRELRPIYLRSGCWKQEMPQ